MKSIDIEKKIFDWISEIYIFFIIVLFPLVVDKTGFFHIFEIKWSVYVIVTSVFIVLCFITYIFFLIFKKINYFKEFNFDIVQISALIFLLVNVISYILSPYRDTHNLIIGVGRGEGLLVSSLYIISFLIISMISRFKKRYLLYFNLSFLFLNIIAVLQFLGFNPFNMYHSGIGIHNVSFLTTIGNIDFVSAIYCILLAISFSFFVFLEDQKTYEKVIEVASIFMGFMMIAIMQVASGKLAPFVVLVILVPFILINNKRFSKAVLIFGIILLAYGFNLFINPQYHYDIGKYGLDFNFNIYVLLIFIVGGVICYLSYLLKDTNYDLSNKKNLIKYFYYFIGICGVLCIIVLYFYSPPIDMLNEIHELLHGNFDDNFGTYRIFLWRRTFKIIPDYFWFGTGPDAFAIPFMARFTEDIKMLNEDFAINDTAANIYLTIFVNLGVFGFISYLFFIGVQIYEGIKKMNKYSYILLIGIVCYCINAFFNLSVVIVSPIFWILMAVHDSCLSLKIDDD